MSMNSFNLINEITKGKGADISSPSRGLIYTGNDYGSSHIHLTNQEIQDLRNIETLDFLGIIDCTGQNFSTIISGYPEISDSGLPEYTGVFVTSSHLSGNFRCRMVALYSASSHKVDANIIVLPPEDLIWFVEGDLQLLEGASIGVHREEITLDDDLAPLHLYVRGDLFISKSATIISHHSMIIVGGNLICDGNINLKGELIVAGTIEGSGHIEVADIYYPSS